MNHETASQTEQMAQHELHKEEIRQLQHNRELLIQQGKHKAEIQKLQQELDIFLKAAKNLPEARSEVPKEQSDERTKKIEGKLPFDEEKKGSKALSQEPAEAPSEEERRNKRDSKQPIETQTRPADQLSTLPKLRDSYKFHKKKIEGSRSTRFSKPCGMALDTYGNIYIVDSGNYLIQLFNKNYEYGGTFELAKGSGLGQFSNPTSLAIDPRTGSFIIVDQGNHRLQLHANKTYKSFGGYGSEHQKLNTPHDVVVDLEGNLLVSDMNNHRIQKWSTSGDWTDFEPDALGCTRFGSKGSGDTQLLFPHGLAIDIENNVLVCDYGNHRVQMFNSSGAHLRYFGKKGSGPGEFWFPTGLAVDNTRKILVCEKNNHRIQIISPQGIRIFHTGSGGHGDKQFWYPSSVLLATNGTILVADSGNNRIQLLS